MKLHSFKTQIEQILAIEKHASISKAAKELYLTQPVLSTTLTELEKEINVKIFNRTKKGVIPTEDGIIVLDYIKKIRDEILNIETYAKSNEDLSGNINLILGESFDFLIPELILNFKNTFPKGKLNIEMVRDDNPITMISNRQMDFGICQLHDIIPAHLEKKQLKNCRAVALVPPRHLYASYESLSITQLLSEQIVFGRQYDQSFFLKNYTFLSQPIFDIDRHISYNMLKQNQAIIVDATPLGISQFQQNFLLNIDCAVVPISTSDIPEWPIYFIHPRNLNSKMTSLFFQEIYALLEKYDLFVSEP